MLSIHRVLLSTAILILVLVAVALHSTATKITVVPVDSGAHPQLQNLAGYSFAIVSDLHLQNNDRAFDGWSDLVGKIDEANPDYVFLLGDYSQADLSGANLTLFIDRFSRSLKGIDSPVFLVLGNYETWTDRSAWQRGLASQGRKILENEVRVVADSEKPLCVRGIGDHFTGHDRYIEFPGECSGLPQVTITHDPGGVFQWRRGGFFLAGHTHCGQLRAPLLGILWAPTNAPRSGQCGFHRDQQRILFTSSGVGTSILPFRFLAQSQVEILKFEGS